MRSLKYLFLYINMRILLLMSATGEFRGGRRLSDASYHGSSAKRTDVESSESSSEEDEGEGEGYADTSYLQVITHICYVM